MAPDRTVYAVESGNNNRVQKFDPIGAFQGTWGAVGEAPGQFANASGIATDAQGNVYVADSSNNRIQKFDGAGNLLATWGVPGTGDGEFKGPADVAVDGAGNVYVADQANNRVQRFDSAGAFRSRLGANGGDGTPGAGPGEFDGPGSIAVDAAGYIYVLDDFNSRVQKFAATPELSLKAKKRQPLKRVKVKLTCESGPCTVRATGKGKVGHLKIKLKPQELTLDAGETAKLKLKPKGRKSVRRAAAMLDRGAKAKLTVKATATNEAGQASAKQKVRLR